MAELPTGTVTFLFTDVEGSTRLLRELGPAYGAALAEHSRLIRAAAEANGGVEVDTQGDAFFFAFPSPSAAVAAAADAQQALAEGALRVRMGLHTGEPELTSEGYVGLDVHLGARIASSAHGGQIVLSRATHGGLDREALVRDLGEHRVKDFDAPVWIYQLGDDEFPPLKTISNTNLPHPASAFVGREHEVSEVVELLRGEARLVTLTGPGGTGKTRIAIEAAAELVPSFRAGVFWVGLADIRDAALVLDTIARVLGAIGDLASHIGDRELLLLLDNFEQVVEAAPELSRLLEACGGLHLLVTSREVLRIAGEVELAVEPLEDGEAVELFCARARCEADDQVRALCAALDNLPLALELAAARARVLSPAQILSRVSERLDLFVGGRDVGPRQRTLRAAIEWSHELLSPAERRLFADLAVFEGGWSFEAAERVVDAELDVLQELAEKSLVRLSDERFWMLETIRTFAVEQLELSGRASDLFYRHADYFRALAEEIDELLDVEGQPERLLAIDGELPNLRAAIDRCLSDGGSHELGLALAGLLAPLWTMRGHLVEGRKLLEAALAASPDRSAARAVALRSLALVTTLQGDWPAGERWSDECIDVSRTLGLREVEAQALATLGRSLLARGEPVLARNAFETSAALGEETGQTRMVGMALFNLGWASLTAGDLSSAQVEFEDSLARFTAAGWDYGVTRSLTALATVLLKRHAVEDALPQLRRSLELSRRLGDLEDGVWALELYGVALAPATPERSACLLGAAEAGREQLGISAGGRDSALHDAATSALAVALGDAGLARVWAEGRRLGLERAIDLALLEARDG